MACAHNPGLSGSLIAATDPVATLATYASLKVDPVLNVMVFGAAGKMVVEASRFSDCPLKSIGFGVRPS
jgi:hypothetical protein